MGLANTFIVRDEGSAHGYCGALANLMRRRHLFAGRAVHVGIRCVREVRRSEMARILVRHLRTVALEADIRVVDRMLDYY